MPAKLKSVEGSHLRTILIRSARKVLELAGDYDETVLLARLTRFDVVEEPAKHFLDMHKQYSFEFESFCLPPHFDPANPELLVRRLDSGIGDTQALIDGDLEGSFSDWDVVQYYGTPTELGLPKECLRKLADELCWLRRGEIEEYLGLGHGVPLPLSPGVAAIYAIYADPWGNDNLEEWDQ